MLQPLTSSAAEHALHQSAPRRPDSSPSSLRLVSSTRVIGWAGASGVHTVRRGSFMTPPRSRPQDRFSLEHMFAPKVWLKLLIGCLAARLPAGGNDSSALFFKMSSAGVELLELLMQRTSVWVWKRKKVHLKWCHTSFDFQINWNIRLQTPSSNFLGKW